MYTNGPWAIEDPIQNQLWIVEAGKQPHDWRDIAIICEGDEHGWPAEVAQANARLIAAAPELLAALEACAEYFRHRHHSLHLKAQEMTRAALAKAKGEA